MRYIALILLLYCSQLHAQLLRVDTLMGTEVITGYDAATTSPGEPAPLSIDERPILPSYPASFDITAYNKWRQSISYPKECKDAGIQGRVYAKFTVSTQGKVDSVWILKSPRYGKPLEEEVIRAINRMPIFQPAMDNGKPVKVTFILPVRFRIIGIPVTEKPIFKGGEDSLKKYIEEHLFYPEKAKRKGREGKVVITLTIGRDGKVLYTQLNDGFYTACNKAALRMAQEMPAWEPGTIDGKTEVMDVKLVVEFKVKEKLMNE